MIVAISAMKALSLGEATGRAAGISPRSARLATGSLFEVLKVGADWRGHRNGNQEQGDGVSFQYVCKIKFCLKKQAVGMYLG